MNYCPGTAVGSHDPRPAPRGIPGSARFWVVFAACGVAGALLVLKPVMGVGIVGGLIGTCVMGYLIATTLGGKVEPVILTWALIFPLGYYFLSFPRERSIITLDRLLPVALLLAIGLASRDKSKRLPRALRRCALAWIAFLAVAATSLLRDSNLVSGRLLVDGFCLPAILGWVVIRDFRVEENAATLHLVTSLMAFYVAGIGVAEVVLRQDLLPLPGGEITFAGALARPNGPFWNNDVFALIGLVTFFLLLFLRNLLGENVSLWRRVFHCIGLTAALATALMPMFRSVGISLMVILLIAALSARTPSRRLAGFALLLVCVLAVSLVSILAPDTYADRSNPDNVYGRLAEQMQTWHLFSSHPLFGVGLGRFTETVNGDTRYLAFYDGVRSVNSPHNILGGILAETGILGFVPYVAAQIALFLVFWPLRRKREPRARLAWTYFLYIFLAYWINNMTLASGYSSDLNLWFIFSIAVLYKYSITENAASAELFGRAGRP